MKKRWSMLSFSIPLVVCGGFVLYLFFPRIIGNLFPPDPQLFSNPECMLPCWQGLRVGETTAVELETFLSSDLFYDYGTSQLTNRVAYGAGRSTGLAEYSVQANTRNGHLFVVRIQRTNITLGDGVNHLGAPDHIRLNVVQNIDSPFAPRMWSVLEVYYPEQGLIFNIGDVGAEETLNGSYATVCLEEQARVLSVVITESGSIDNLILNGIYFNDVTTEMIDLYRNSLTSWTGFTCVERLILP